MRSLLKLKPYVRPYWGYILASALLAIPLAYLNAYPVILIREFVDNILVLQDPRKVLLYPFRLVVAYSLKLIFRFFHYYLMRVAVVRSNQKLKNHLFNRLTGLSADYFTSQSTGTLISRVGSDPQYVDSALTSITAIIREPIQLAIYLSVCIHISWRMTLFLFLIVPPMAWIFRMSSKNLRRYISKITQENARIFSILQETFTGIRVVKTFRLEKYVRKKFRQRTGVFADQLLKTSALEEFAHPLVELLMGLLIALVLYFGSREVVEHHITQGQLLQFMLAFGMTVDPIRTINETYLKLQQAGQAARRIFEVFDWKSNLHEPKNPRKLSHFGTALTFEHVHFAYPDAPARPVLSDVSFRLEKGKSLALVGASGAGKSSLVSLIPRIFDITQGTIRVDGVDIRELDLDDLRSQISVVSQDIFLFNDTIEENIRCGRLSATPTEIREAARRAHADEFIDRAPEGYQAIIGDRGQKLSGGEKQRLSIARAFLRQSPILILDEATSSLDTRSEKIVQEALDDLMKDRTTLMIAHRLSTVRNASQIHVMKDGQIVESGTHAELLAKQGEYLHLHQAGGITGF